MFVSQPPTPNPFISWWLVRQGLIHWVLLICTLSPFHFQAVRRSRSSIIHDEYVFRDLIWFYFWRFLFYTKEERERICWVSNSFRSAEVYLTIIRQYSDMFWIILEIHFLCKITEVGDPGNNSTWSYWSFCPLLFCFSSYLKAHNTSTNITCE